MNRVINGTGLKNGMFNFEIARLGLQILCEVSLECGLAALRRVKNILDVHIIFYATQQTVSRRPSAVLTNGGKMGSGENRA